MANQYKTASVQETTATTWLQALHQRYAPPQGCSIVLTTEKLTAAVEFLSLNDYFRTYNIKIRGYDIRSLAGLVSEGLLNPMDLQGLAAQEITCTKRKSARPPMTLTRTPTDTAGSHIDMKLHTLLTRFFESTNQQVSATELLNRLAMQTIERSSTVHRSETQTEDPTIKLTLKRVQELIQWAEKLNLNQTCTIQIRGLSLNAISTAMSRDTPIDGLQPEEITCIENPTSDYLDGTPYPKGGTGIRNTLMETLIIRILTNPELTMQDLIADFAEEAVDPAAQMEYSSPTVLSTQGGTYNLSLAANGTIDDVTGSILEPIKRTPFTHFIWNNSWNRVLRATQMDTHASVYNVLKGNATVLYGCTEMQVLFHLQHIPIGVIVLAPQLEGHTIDRYTLDATRFHTLRTSETHNAIASDPRTKPWKIHIKLPPSQYPNLKGQHHLVIEVHINSATHKISDGQQVRDLTKTSLQEIVQQRLQQLGQPQLKKFEPTAMVEVSNQTYSQATAAQQLLFCTGDQRAFRRNAYNVLSHGLHHALSVQETLSLLWPLRETLPHINRYAFITPFEPNKLQLYLKVTTTTGESFIERYILQASESGTPTYHIVAAESYNRTGGSPCHNHRPSLVPPLPANPSTAMVLETLGLPKESEYYPKEHHPYEDLEELTGDELTRKTARTKPPTLMAYRVKDDEDDLPTNEIDTLRLYYKYKNDKGTRVVIFKIVIDENYPRLVIEQHYSTKSGATKTYNPNPLPLTRPPIDFEWQDLYPDPMQLFKKVAAYAGIPQLDPTPLHFKTKEECCQFLHHNHPTTPEWRIVHFGKSGDIMDDARVIKRGPDKKVLAFKLKLTKKALEEIEIEPESALLNAELLLDPDISTEEAIQASTLNLTPQACPQYLDQDTQWTRLGFSEGQNRVIILRNITYTTSSTNI